MKASPSCAAFTLIEAGVALAVAGVALSGIMMLNSSALQLVRSSRMSNAATLVIQERVEQMRIANWRDITDATYINGTFFATTPDSGEPLGEYVETLTLSAYPDPSVTEKLKVKKSPTEVLTISTGADISEQSLVRVDYRLEWAGESGRQRNREATTILSKVGVSSLNLAFAGAIGNEPESSESPSPTSDSSPTPSESASASPTPSDPDSGGNSGSGGSGGGASDKNRGNVNGQPGSK